MNKELLSKLDRFENAIAEFVQAGQNFDVLRQKSQAYIRAQNELLAAIEEEKKKNLVVVEIRGGCASVIPGDSNAWIVDYDNLESGDCPICGLKVDDDKFCELCNIRWSDEPDVYEYFRKREEQ